ncbi:MAG: hypothetical protein GX417_01260 [Clostridiales bacterium]|nr:hypothetical protein [Clostridiales bacterium]
MERHLHIVTGHYGSGKTEFSINLALALARAGDAVALADLDIVNPYFCSRGQRTALEAQGVRVIASAGGDADLPAINPAVYALLESGVCGIMDVGGDAAGARVLGRFAQKIQAVEHELLCVLNFNRPETATAEQAERYLRDIERSAKLRTTGLVNNTHLCGETAARDVLRGAELAQAVSARTGIPVRWHSFPRRLAGAVDLPPETLFPMDLLLKKPWETDCSEA